eukprot:GHRR01008824.1.p1 GENE.GHRR01008824.1~~GHRR01008824.1.p1  ORF type:complete len:366 (+),score=156.08 GHRR01008824.1:261-1358(+)
MQSMSIRHAQGITSPMQVPSDKHVPQPAWRCITQSSARLAAVRCCKPFAGSNTCKSVQRTANGVNTLKLLSRCSEAGSNSSNPACSEPSLQDSSNSSKQRWNLGLAAAFGLAAVAASAVAASPAHAEPVAQLSQAISAIKIPGLVGDSQFTEGFVSGLLLIFFSEIGDKTFFIALLLALKQDRTAVFTGTFGALAIMTVISVVLGQVFHQLDELLPASSVPLDDLLAVALLLYFGVNTLRDAATADFRAAEEKEEADEVVTSLSSSGAAAATATLVASTFSLVFAAEWGDKSFLATIALAAASDPAGVIFGAVTGHGLATGIAVAGGSLLSRYISERTAQYIGGSLFLVFAAATIFDILTGAHGG